MLKISQSKEFKKDFIQYKKDIDQITNERAKEKCKDILTLRLLEMLLHL